jgi:hypothetical protein
MERLILTILILTGLVSFILPVRKRLLIVQKGKGKFNVDDLPRRIQRFVSEVIFQRTVINQRPLPGLMHAFVFWGFVAFIIMTLNHFTGGYGWEFLGHGAVYRIISTIVAVFAVMVLIGIIYLAIRRFVFRPESLGEHFSYTSGIVALFIIILMVTYLLGLYTFQKGTTEAAVNWWVHAFFILAFMALIPQSKHLHLILSPFTTFLKDFS